MALPFAMMPGNPRPTGLVRLVRWRSPILTMDRRPSAVLTVPYHRPAAPAGWSIPALQPSRCAVLPAGCAGHRRLWPTQQSLHPSSPAYPASAHLQHPRQPSRSGVYATRSIAPIARAWSECVRCGWVKSQGCVVTPLCNRWSEAHPPQWEGKEAAQRRCSDSQRGGALKTSSPTRGHPIGLARQSEATSVCPGQRPVLWAWLDLNQRPHPYQVSRAKRCADQRFPRSRATVRGQGMRLTARRIRAHTRCRGHRQGDGAAGWARQPHRVCRACDCVRLRARPGLCGWCVWWPARPAQR